MRKRVLSLLLVLAMVFSLFPVGVVAEATEAPATTADTFTFTFERVDEHAAVVADETVDVNVYLNWSGAAAQSVNGFQLTFGSGVTLSGVELKDAVEGAAEAAIGENNTLLWLDETTEDASKCYNIGTEPTLVATATLTVGAGADLTSLKTLLGASGGAVCIWGVTEDNTPAELAYKANTGCSHDGDTACEAAHANLGTQWVELTSATIGEVQNLAADTHYYYLTGDVTDSSGLIFNGNATGAAAKIDLVICLNGHTLKASGGKMFDLRKEGQNVTICNCSEDEGKLRSEKGDLSYGAICTTRGGSSFSAYNCTVEAADGLTYQEGSAFFVQAANDLGGSLTLENVTIQNFKATGGSKRGTVMILQNHATSTASFKNVTIQNCTADDYDLFYIQKGTATFEDVTIKDCTNSDTSSGEDTIISVQDGGTLKLKGNIQIDGNNRNYIYIKKNTGKVVIDGVDPQSHIELRTNTAQTTADEFNAGTWLTTTDAQTEDYAITYWYNGTYHWTLAYDADAEAGSKYTLHAHQHAADKALGLDAITFNEWTSTTSLPTSGNWYLTQPVVTSTKAAVASGKTLNLCLNGQTVTWKPASALTTGRVFDVSGTLNIYDCAATVGGFTADYTEYQPNVNGSFAKVNAGATLKLYNGKIYGFNTHGTTSNDGTIYLAIGDTTTAGGKFYMYDGEISDNTVSRNGVIYLQGDGTNKGGVVQLEGGKICNNTVGRYGGAVYMGASGQNATTGAFYMKGGEISGNTSGSFASALYSLGGEIKITGGIIRNNNGQDATDARVIVGDGKLHSAMIQAVNSRTLYIQAAEGKEIIIDASGVDEHAIAPMHGSKLYMSGAEVTAKDGYNAIHVQHYADADKNDVRGKDAVLQLSDVVLNGNVYYYNTVAATFTDVELNGDATFEIAEAGNKPSTTTSGYKVIYTSVTLSGNIQMAEGKKFNLPLGKSLTVKDLDPVSAFTFTQTGVTADAVTADPAAVNGTAIITASGDVTSWPCQTVKFHNGTEAIGVAYAKNRFYLSNDHVHADGTVYQPWAGITAPAGNYYLTGKVELTAKQTGLIESPQGAWTPVGANKLCLNGFDFAVTGATKSNRVAVIHVKGEGNSLVIDDCTAYTDAEGTYYAGKITGGVNGYGAGVRAEINASLTLNNGKITGNTADHNTVHTNNTGGAGVYLTNSASFTMNGGEISDNHSMQGVAGGVQLNNNTSATSFTMNGGTIKGNTASGNGGAIHVAKDCTVQITNGTVEQNSTDADGGAIYASANGIEISAQDSSFKSNEAAGNGGAIYFSVTNAANDLTIDGGTIANNTATANGGGIYVGGTAAGTVEIKGTTVIKGNSGKQGGGICISTKGPIVNISDITIGGSGTVDALVDPNVSTETTTSISCGGGGLFVDNNQTTTLTNVTVQSNQAHRCGAGIAADNSAKVTIIGGKVQHNKTTNQAAAGIYFETSSAVTLNGTEVTENWCSSTTGSAGVYFGASAAADLTLVGDVIIDNNYCGANNVEANMFVPATQSTKAVGEVNYQRVTWDTMADNVNVDGLTSGARIGVTLFNAVYTAPWMYFTAPMNTTKDLSDCFFSDKDGYGIVQLTRKADLSHYCHVVGTSDWFPHAGGDASATVGTQKLEETASTRLYLCAATYDNDPYMTPADAVAASTGNVADGFVKLFGDAAATDLGAKDLYLDLNGNDANVTTTGKVYAIDSSTDDYTNADTDGVYGKLTTTSSLGYTDSQYTANGKRYVALSEGENTYSFHRVYLSIYSTLYRTLKNGIGFKAMYAADEAVAELINGNDGTYGIELNMNVELGSVTDGYKANVNTSDPEFTFESGKGDGNPNKLLVAVTDILAKEAPYTEGDAIKTRAESVITGQPFITFKDGETTITIEGKNTNESLDDYSLKYMVNKAAEANVTGSAFTNIQAMISQYSEYFTVENGYENISYFTTQS